MQTPIKREAVLLPAGSSSTPTSGALAASGLHTSSGQGAFTDGKLRRGSAVESPLPGITRSRSPNSMRRAVSSMGWADGARATLSASLLDDDDYHNDKFQTALLGQERRANSSLGSLGAENSQGRAFDTDSPGKHHTAMKNDREWTWTTAGTRTGASASLLRPGDRRMLSSADEFKVALRMPGLPTWKMGRQISNSKSKAVGEQVPIDLTDQVSTDRHMQVDLHLPKIEAPRLSSLSVTQNLIQEENIRLAWATSAMEHGSDSSDDGYGDAIDVQEMLRKSQARRQTAATRLAKVEEEIRAKSGNPSSSDQNATGTSGVQNATRAQPKLTKQQKQEMVAKQRKLKRDQQKAELEKFLKTLAPEDADIPIHLIKTSEIYGRIRKLRNDFTGREKLASEIEQAKKDRLKKILGGNDVTNMIERNRKHVIDSEPEYHAEMLHYNAWMHAKHVYQVRMKHSELENEREEQLRTVIEAKMSRKAKAAAEAKRKAFNEQRMVKQRHFFLLVILGSRMQGFLTGRKLEKEMSVLSERRKIFAKRIQRAVARVSWVSRTQKILQIKRKLRKSMWVPLFHMRVARKQTAAKTVIGIMEEIKRRQFGAGAILAYRAKVLRSQRLVRQFLNMIWAQRSICFRKIVLYLFSGLSTRIQNAIKNNLIPTGHMPKSGSKSRATPMSKSVKTAGAQTKDALKRLQSSVSLDSSLDVFRAKVHQCIVEWLNSSRKDHARMAREFHKQIQVLGPGAQPGLDLVDPARAAASNARVQEAVLQSIKESNKIVNLSVRALTGPYRPSCFFLDNVMIEIVERCLAETVLVVPGVKGATIVEKFVATHFRLK